MLYRALPYLVLLAALFVGCFFRSSPVARGGAIVVILATVALPFLGIIASHRLATVRYVDSAHQPPSEEYRAGAIAARDAAHEQLPFLSGIIVSLAVLAALPPNRLRGHGTCGRPPPPFRPPAGAAPAPPVAELEVVRRLHARPMTKHLHIGGLVAAGFDSTGAYLLTISHAGRGVFSATTWERVARDSTLAYPTEGHAVGIGPIEGVPIPITEIDYDTGVLRFSSPNGMNSFEYDSGTLTITNTNA